MLHRLMRVEFGPNLKVEAAFVGVQPAILGNVVGHDLGDGGLVGNSNIERANAAAALNEGDDRALVRGLAALDEGASAGRRGARLLDRAVVGLVGLHDAASAAQRAADAAVSHGLTDAMAHE